jgi:hypothetical protein
MGPCLPIASRESRHLLSSTPFQSSSVGMSNKRSVLPNFGVDQAFADRQNLAPHKSSSRGGTAGKAALFKNEETRPRWRVGREEILSRQPARADGPAQLGRNHQGAMDLRAGPSAAERGTRPRPLRGTILARPSPSCATPSLSSSLDCRLSDARTAEDGSARNRRVNESAKVVLGIPG